MSDGHYLAANDASRARLGELLGRMQPADLGLPVGDGRWIVAQVVGHLAFWDRFLAARWRAALAADPEGQPTVLPAEIPGLLNDALPAAWAAIAAGAARAEALAAATEVDSIIASLAPGPRIEAILAERPSLLDRSIHRSEHLDAVEAALAAGRR